MTAPADVPLKIVLPPDPWVQAIPDGRVRIPGYAWECNNDIQNAMIRFDVTEGADIGENGVRRLVVEYLQGSVPTAIPVWYGREHMQRNLLVLRGSDLHHPKNLVGKRVGSQLTPFSATAGGVMLLMEQAYGVAPTDIEWRLGDPRTLPVNRMGLRLDRGPDTADENIELLLQGELDAVIVTSGPRYRSLFGGDQIDRLLGAYSAIRPLIEDPLVIADAYRRTRLYPITDLVIIRPSAAAARDADLASKVFAALSEANNLASMYRSAEEEAFAQREIELLGRDPHRYGLGGEQRHNLAAWVDFLYRLGAFDSRVEPEDLFVPMAAPEIQ